MLHTRRFLLPTLARFGCLAAALVASPLLAQAPIPLPIPLQVDYTDGQNNSASYDVSGSNSPTTLNILSGTATQSGVLSGSGMVYKTGAGTLILSGLNTYTNDTYIRAGTLQVVKGASLSQLNASFFVADQSGEVARLLITGGTVGFGFGGGDHNYIGNQAGSSGTVDVTGGDWTYGLFLHVGYFGTGLLNISGGTTHGANGDGSINIGSNVGGSGTVNVSGGTLRSQYLRVGYAGTGVLGITGGAVNSSFSFLGNDSGSTGTANVSGGTWTNSGVFSVGNYGTGVLNLTGGTIDNSGVDNYLGANGGGSGTANVSGGTWKTGMAYIGSNGTGVANLSGGSIQSSAVGLGYYSTGSGTVNMSGGSWIIREDISIGLSGTGVLNMSGGSLSNNSAFLGYFSGSSGTATVRDGTWTNSGELNVGYEGGGTLNISGGSVTATDVNVATMAMSNGTVNVSGGTLNATSSLSIGTSSNGVFNLTGGEVSVGGGTGVVTLANTADGIGTLNIGTGASAGTLNALSVYGGAGTAVVNFNHLTPLTFTPSMAGSISLNQIGSGTTILEGQSTYLGETAVLGGTLQLAFGSVSSDILPGSSNLRLGSGTLSISGQGTQSFGGFYVDSGGGGIMLRGNETLTLGDLKNASDYSAVNFNTAAGGAAGATVGTGIIMLTGQTAGSVINSGFTVTDSTGFGLATVNGDDQIIRLTTSDLLPASGADAGTNYRIDNNDGGSTSAGSASLIVTASQTAKSITVDTTAAAGILSLASGAVLSTDVWNIGGVGTHAFTIGGEDSTAGLTSATASGFLVINNYNTASVTIAAGLLDNSGTSVQFQGPGTTILSGSSSYQGSTLVYSGLVIVATTGSISNTMADTTVGSFTGNHAQLNILGSVHNSYGYLGYSTNATGTVNVDGGTWTNDQDLSVGQYGIGLLNLISGSVTSKNGYVGYESGSQGTVNVTNGTWTLSQDLYVGRASTSALLQIKGSGSVSSGNSYVGYYTGSAGRVSMNSGTWTTKDLYIGRYGAAELGFDGGTIHSGNSYLGAFAGSSAAVTVNGGTWSNINNLHIGGAGTAVLEIYSGSISSYDIQLGVSAGGSGTASISGGSMTSTNALTIGNDGTGILNLSDGTVSSLSATLGSNTGSGTANVSGGTWATNDLTVGSAGAGTLNLTNDGTLIVGLGGRGDMSLAVGAGSKGTLNIGTGGAAGTLQAASVTGGSGTAVVNFNQTNTINFSAALYGSLSVNQIGNGTTILNSRSSYSGPTSVLAGTLLLSFDTVSTNIISSSTPVSLGGGTLKVDAAGTQTLLGFTTNMGTASKISVSGGSTLNLGTLYSAGAGSALNFDLSATGADGETIGDSIITISGKTAGAVINRSFTVTDSTGFGLATVNEDDQIIRLTTSDLLPASGAVAGTNYRIDNNDGGSTSAGSASLIITDSQTVSSITVDTTAASGTLTLAPGAVLSTDVWNFGGGGSNTYAITGSESGAGISTATEGGTLEINSYNNDFITISAPILDNGGSGLRISATGEIALAGDNTYTGNTVITRGTVFIEGNQSAATGTTTVQNTATLAGIGTLGGGIVVQSGGILAPGDALGAGTLSGTTASFAAGSIFSIQDGNGTLGTLHLTGAITINPGALLRMNILGDLTESSYTLITAASGLNSDSGFTLMGDKRALPRGYHLAYDGTSLKLVSNAGAPSVAYWTGNTDNLWSSISSGSTNWATDSDGLTDTGAAPGAPTDVTFSATGVDSADPILDIDATVNSLTVNSETYLGAYSPHSLTVNSTTTVNALLYLDSGVTIIGNDAFTIGTEGMLSGYGAVEMAADKSIFVNGAISVRAPENKIYAHYLSLTTSGTGAIVMGADSTIHVDLYKGAGLGDNTLLNGASDILNIHGTLDATAGGTLVLGNPKDMTGFAGGDQWKVIELNGGDGTITGHLALNDSGLGLSTGFVGSFDQTTGIYTIEDHRAEYTAGSSGLPMANAQSQAIISGTQTATSDVNNHLFNLRSGGGEEGDDDDGGISASLDYGVVMGEGDGPESPMARRVKRSRQWEVFTTVTYGNVRLTPISSQAGVQVDSWASSVGIERHLSRGLTLGFAATFLQSHQAYTNGIGHLDLEGPTLSTYLAYARKGVWASLMYSFGAYDLGSQRNPGLGLPSASGATTAYVNSVQFNTGYNFRFQNNTLVTGPFIGLDYLHGSVDAYSETGGGAGALSYARQSFESLVSRVGWSLSKQFDTEWALITPQLRLSYERQNVKNNGTSVSLINAPFSASGGNQTPGQDYMVLGGGVNFQFTPDFSMLLGYQLQLFRNNMSSQFGSVRFGYKF